MYRTAIRQASWATSKQSAGLRGGDHRHRALAVAAEDGLQQVGLLGLGRQAGRRAAALHVDDDHRQLGHHRQAHAFALERDARAAAGGDGHRAGERGADRGRHRGDFVFGLEREHVEVLVLWPALAECRWPA